MGEPEKNEEELNEAYASGESAGLEKAGDLIMQHALKAFERHEPTASLLRGLAENLKAMAGERHPGPRTKG